MCLKHSANKNNKEEIQMKKIIATIALTAASTAALATGYDITATGNRNYPTDTNNVRLAVGHQFGALRGEVEASRDLTGRNKVANYGANVGYSLAPLYGVTLTPKVGVNYLHADSGASGYGVRTGVAAALPLTATTSLVADYSYLRNERALRRLDGNSVGLGLRTSF
jgi:hypothetical protein